MPPQAKVRPDGAWNVVRSISATTEAPTQSEHERKGFHLALLLFGEPWNSGFFNAGRVCLWDRRLQR